MKIDTSKIPNFDSLPEETKTAILGMEFSDPVDMAQFVSKATFDKKASEAADLAKQLKAKMTDDEAKEAERAENERKIMEELETLRKEKQISEYTSRYLTLGYDPALAADTAKAFSTGNMDAVFANHQKHLESVKKAAAAESLAKNDALPAGKDAGGMTIEKFRKMTPQERYSFSEKHPEEYKTLYGGN